MLDILQRALVIVGQVLLLWFILGGLVVIVWGAYRENQRKHARREQERLSAAWARNFGGNPKYQGGLGRRVA